MLTFSGCKPHTTCFRTLCSRMSFPRGCRPSVPIVKDHNLGGASGTPVNCTVLHRDGHFMISILRTFCHVPHVSLSLDLQPSLISFHSRPLEYHVHFQPYGTPLCHPLITVIPYSLPNRSQSECLPVFATWWYQNTFNIESLCAPAVVG